MSLRLASLHASIAPLPDMVAYPRDGRLVDVPIGRLVFTENQRSEVQIPCQLCVSDVLTRAPRESVGLSINELWGRPWRPGELILVGDVNS